MRFVFIISGKRCDCDGGVTGGGGFAALGPGAEVAECGVGEKVSCRRAGRVKMDKDKNVVKDNNNAPAKNGVLLADMDVLYIAEEEGLIDVYRGVLL